MFAFDYVSALCSAVEGLTGSVVHEEPRALHYGGIDLRFATERDLYFSAINDPAMQQQFASSRASLGGSPLQRDGHVEARAGDFVCRYFDDGRHMSLRYQPRRTTRARRLLGRGANHIFWPYRAGRFERDLASSAPNLEHARLFIMVHHERFVRYLRPIAEVLGSAGVVWLSTGAELSRQLRSTDVSHVPVDRWNHLHYGRSVHHFSSAPSPGFSYLMALCDALQHLFALRRPSCLLLVEGNAARDEAANQVAKQLGVPTICVQQGWSPFVHNGFRNMSYGKMLIWGDGFADALRPYNPLQDFVVTGSHMLDGAVRESRPAWLREKAAGRRCITFFLQSPMGIIGQRGWRQSLELLVAAAERCPEARFFAREHPIHPLRGEELELVTRHPNVCLAPVDRCSLAELLAVTHASVSIYSTTILESIALAVPPLIYNCTSMPRFNPDVDALGAGLEVHDSALALRQIERLIEDEDFCKSFEPGMDRFRDRFFGKIDGQSCDRIVETIRCVMDDA